MRKALLALLACAPLFPQGSTGRIDGTITDQSGGAIVGAKVTVTDVQRGVTRTLTTDTAGAYSAPNLIPGSYSMRAEFQGFRTVERKDVAVEVAQQLRVDLQMQPGEQSQTVTVTGEAPAIETANAELGGTIANNVINELPLNGRNFENLLDLRPGVSKYPGNSGWTNSTNGLRPHDNYFMVEGINSSDPWMAQSIMNAVMAAGDAGTILPIDAIDEFRLQQNPRAEYGWKPAPWSTSGSNPAAIEFMAPRIRRANGLVGRPRLLCEHGAASLAGAVRWERRRPDRKGQAFLLRQF